MSWSMSSSDVPPSTMFRSWRPSSTLSAVSSPAAGSSASRSFGPAARARGDADQLALALRQLRRLAVGEVLEAEQGERGVRGPAGAAAARRDEVGEHVLDAGVGRPDLEVAGDGEVLEDLDRLPGPDDAGVGPPVGRPGGQVLAVEHDAAACSGRSP